MTDCQRVTWIVFAILAIFFFRITSVSKSNWEMVSRVSQRQQLWTLSNGICSFTAEHSFLWNISLLKKTEQGIDLWYNFGILYFPSCCSSPALDPGILDGIIIKAAAHWSAIWAQYRTICQFYRSSGAASQQASTACGSQLSPTHNSVETPW